MLRRRKGFLAQSGQQTRGDPEQSTGIFLLQQGDQLVAHGSQASHVGRGVFILEPFEQAELELHPQMLGLLGQLGRFQAGVRTARRTRQGFGQIRSEQHAFRQALFTACRAQIIEQGQQHDRNVFVPGLQAFEVVGQLHDAAHQHGIGIVTIADGVAGERSGQVFHFFGHHRGAVQLDHSQGALHLMQVSRAEPHLTDVGRIFDVRLQRLASLLQGLVEFTLDPGECGEIDVFLKPHARVSLD